MVDDPLLLQRLRLPARLNGGALRERGGWLADASYTATMLRVREALRQAANMPTDGALSDPPARAGHSMLSAEVMAEGEGGEGDEEDERMKEQKQITMAVEKHTSRELRSCLEALPANDMRKISYFSSGPSSRHWIYTPPYPGCELSSAEFQVLVCRYYGVPDVVLADYVGRPIRKQGAAGRGAVLDVYGKELANANIGGDRWRLRHDAVLSVVKSELLAANQEVRDNVYGLFEGRFGERNDESSRRTAAYCDRLVGTGDKRRRRRQGLLPDLLVEPAIDHRARVVQGRVLFELKQINLVQQHF